MFGIRGSHPGRFHGAYEPGVSGIISCKARRRWNYRFRSEHCKSGSKIELCRAVLRELQSKFHSCLARPHEFVGECLLYVNHV
jgi:hypothetical protein